MDVDTQQLLLGFGLAVAALAGWNRIAVRASGGMAEKGADTRVELWADDVLELAGLRVRFGLVHGKGVFEKAFCQAVTADHISGALTANRRELGLAVL